MELKIRIVSGVWRVSLGMITWEDDTLTRAIEAVHAFYEKQVSYLVSRGKYGSQSLIEALGALDKLHTFMGVKNA